MEIGCGVAQPFLNQIMLIFYLRGSIDIFGESGDVNGDGLIAEQWYPISVPGFPGIPYNREKYPNR